MNFYSERFYYHEKHEDLFLETVHFRGRNTVFSRMIHYFFRIYGMLLATSVGGLTGAYAFAKTSRIFYQTQGGMADRTDTITWWQHCGWILVGGIFLIMRIYQIRNPRVSLTNVAAEQLVNLKKKGDEQEDQTPPEKSAEPAAQPLNPWVEVVIIIWLGGFMGALMGVSLLLIWYSLTWSPFYPASDSDSISINLNVSLYLVGISSVLGAAGSVVSHVKYEMNMKNRTKDK